MFEHHSQPLISSQELRLRIIKSVCITLVLIIISMIVGTLGYHFWGEAKWIDAFHNSALILSGMGPVIEIHSTSGKIFSSLFALYGGILLVSNTGILLAPLMHRMMHRLHLDEND